MRRAPDHVVIFMIAVIIKLLHLRNMDGSEILRMQLSSLFRLQNRSQMLRRRVERQLHDDRQFVFLQQLTQHAKATQPGQQGWLEY